MMRTYFKTFIRMFKKHITRFLSIVFMVLVSIGFSSGIVSINQKLDDSLSEYYRVQNVADVTLKCTGETLFTAEQIAALKEQYGEENVNTGISLDAKLSVGGEERLSRLTFLDFDHWTVSVPELTAGERVTNSDENLIYVSRGDNRIAEHEIGDKIELDFVSVLKQMLDESYLDQYGGLLDSLNIKPKTVTVAGIIQSPLIFAKDGEPSFLNGDAEVPDSIGGIKDIETLQEALYLPAELLASAIQEVLDASFPGAEIPTHPVGDVYIAFQDRTRFQAFQSSYRDYLDAQTGQIGALLSEDEGEAFYRVISLYDNYSFVSLHSYGDKVNAIGIVLMIAFVLVTALVVLSTMTRLLDEERAQIACLKSLGYTSAQILFKYLLFAFIATGIGGVGSCFVGFGIARVLYIVFHYSFDMPPMVAGESLGFYFITLSVIIVTAIGATLMAGHRQMSESPASLLRPKPPRAGKKVFLEKIPFLWKRISFKYKSTLRNVLRYFNRFLMTVAAVAVSAALIMAGLSLLDLCLFGELDSPSIIGVSLLVVFFAGLLTVVVIYTLTNINISERTRELATLGVLGYHKHEITGYIYREVYIDTAVGILFGYPLSALIIWKVFDIMELGTLGGVSWFWWIMLPFVVLGFTFVVTLALRRKITKIDMNESLKAIE